ncbi:unnamed protein product, partial [Scytosiphon promiscuus]
MHTSSLCQTSAPRDMMDSEGVSGVLARPPRARVLPAKLQQTGEAGAACGHGSSSSAAASKAISSAAPAPAATAAARTSAKAAGASARRVGSSSASVLPGITGRSPTPDPFPLSGSDDDGGADEESDSSSDFEADPGIRKGKRRLSKHHGRSPSDRIESEDEDEMDSSEGEGGSGKRMSNPQDDVASVAKGKKKSKRPPWIAALEKVIATPGGGSYSDWP